MIDSVRVTHVSESAAGLPPLRSLEIRANGATITTPARCATWQEMEMNRRHGLGVRLENSIAVYAHTLFRMEALRLVSGTEAAAELAARLAAFGSSAAPLRLCSFQIGGVALGAPSPLLERCADQDALVKRLIQLQVAAGNDTVSIPHMGLNPEAALAAGVEAVPSESAREGTAPGWLRERLREIHDKVSSLRGQALFSVDMGYFAFADVLDYVTGDLGSPMVNLIYRSPASAPRAYACIREYAMREVAFLVTGIPRANAAPQGPSALHCVPFWGGDLLAMETRRGFGYANRPNDTRRLQVFDRDSASLLPLRDAGTLAGRIAGEAGMRDGLRVREILACLESATDDNDAYDRINSVLRLHELRLSTREIAALAESARGSAADMRVRARGALAREIAVKAAR
ncbi:MAG: hypothetical protein OXU85_00840 [Thaumarchaeota archaeon]|nr:hypothetical protein [Nitrososphaerota archaeon]